MLKQSQKLQSQLENIKTGKVLRQIQKKVKYVLLNQFLLKEVQKVLKERTLEYLLLLDLEKISQMKLVLLVDTYINHRV